jgi:hypothetical protein
MINCLQTLLSDSSCAATARRVEVEDRKKQGLPLVHSFAQPELFLSL